MKLRARLVIAVAIVVIGVCPLATGTSARAATGQGEAAIPASHFDQINTLEERAYAAWKAHDAKFWSVALSDRFVGWGSSVRVGKQAAIAMLSGGSCRIVAVRLTGEQLTRLTTDATLLTHKTEVDGTCNGRAVPAAYTVTLYVQEKGQWKIGYRAQSEIVDPMKAIKPADSERWTSGPTQTDAFTQALLPRELAMVDAWKDHDAARVFIERRLRRR